MHCFLIRFFLAVVIFISPVFAQSPPFPIPDTGQTKCYDDVGNEINPCPSPGEPFYGQDGNYSINPMSYTKLAADGSELPDTALSWAMVRDNVTGLIWEVKNSKDGAKNYSNPHDADNTYTWYDPNPETNGGDAGTPGNGTDTKDFIADAIIALQICAGNTDADITTDFDLSEICVTDGKIGLEEAVYILQYLADMRN